MTSHEAATFVLVILCQWSDESLDQLLLSTKHPEVRSHRTLKDRLYHEIIDYFDKGKVSGVELLITI